MKILGQYQQMVTWESAACAIVGFGLQGGKIYGGQTKSGMRVVIRHVRNTVNPGIDRLPDGDTP